MPFGKNLVKALKREPSGSPFTHNRFFAEEESRLNKKKIVSRFLYSQKVAPYVFILPFLLTFSIFFAYPVVNTVAMR